MSRLDEIAVGDISPVVYDVVRVTQPAAGADPVIVVPGNQVWQVLSVTGILTADAVVANRRPTLIIDDQTTTVAQVATGIVTVASQATRYSFVNGYDLETGAAGAAVSDPFMADNVLPSGWRVRFSTLGLDPGDQWSQLAVWVRRINYGVSDWAVARQAAEAVYDDPAPYLT